MEDWSNIKGIRYVKTNSIKANVNNTSLVIALNANRFSIKYNY